MEGEVLYRGIRKDNGAWIYGDLVRNYFHAGDTCIGGMFENLYICIPVVPATVGRYADIEDVRGCRAFEGDYIRIDEEVKRTFEIEDGVLRFGRGGFHIGSFGLLNSLNTIASADWVLRGVVIGNIHDNPILLKGDAK